MIMLGGRLLETDIKRKWQISGLESGCIRLRNLSSGRLPESFWNSIWTRNKMFIYKVVAYRRWSLMRSDHYGRVDCIWNGPCTAKGKGNIKVLYLNTVPSDIAFIQEVLGR